MIDRSQWEKIAYLVVGAIVLVWFVGAMQRANVMGTGAAFGYELEWRGISSQEWTDVINTATGREIQRQSSAKGAKYAALMGISLALLVVLIMIAVYFSFVGRFFTRLRTLFISGGMATVAGFFNAMAQAVPKNQLEPQFEVVVGSSLMYFLIFYAAVGFLVVIRRTGEKFFVLKPIER